MNKLEPGEAADLTAKGEKHQLAELDGSFAQGREPSVDFGFASFSSGRFELIVRDRKTWEETILTGTLEPGQFEIIDRILPTCVYVNGVPRPNDVPPPEMPLDQRAQEISEAWQKLEEHGFPPEACGWPFKSIVGELPNAIDCALNCLIRQRVALEAQLEELRIPAAQAPSEETGWILEKDDPPVYHLVTDDCDEHWTSDVNKALRFARKEDAEAYMDHVGWTAPPVRTAEHMWVAPRAVRLGILAAGMQTPVAWRARNDFHHWHATCNKALADTWREIEKLDVQALYTQPPSPAGHAEEALAMINRLRRMALPNPGIKNDFIRIDVLAISLNEAAALIEKLAALSSDKRPPTCRQMAQGEQWCVWPKCDCKRFPPQSKTLGVDK